MTLQTVAELETRFTRIWAPMSEPRVSTNLDDAFNDEEDIGYFSFYACLQDEVTVCYSRVIQECIEIVGANQQRTYGHVICIDGVFDCGQLRAKYFQMEEEFAQFAARWLPVLRRGCWLSGIPVEASAHEKAEWVQDLTREEVESWNLRL